MLGLSLAVGPRSGLLRAPARQGARKPKLPSFQGLKSLENHGKQVVFCLRPGETAAFRAEVWRLQGHGVGALGAAARGLREGPRLSVTTLNKHVIAALLSEGLPAVAMSPCPFVATERPRVSEGHRMT